MALRRSSLLACMLWGTLDLRSETLTTLATLLTDGLLGSYSSSSSSSSSLMNCGLLRTPDEEVKAGFLEGSAFDGKTCARAGSGPMTLGMGRTSDTLLDATCFSGGVSAEPCRSSPRSSSGSGSALSASTSSLYSPSPRNSGTLPLGSTSLGVYSR
uniref:Putative secreted protein n=1 Tax=Ixodes ricinus TaxID=34613 RepID=A0A6B0UWF1_IXORI